MKKEALIGMLISLLICFMPILDPYILGEIGGFEIHINDVLFALVTAYLLFTKKRIYIHKDLMGLISVLFVVNIISILFFKVGNSSLYSSIRVLMIWTFYIVLFSNVVKESNRIMIKNTILDMGVFVVAIMFFQYVFISLNIVPWNGKIPFFMLSEYDGWSSLVDVTGAIRVHSLFQEPSYLAIYLLPALVVALKENKIFHVIAFTVSIIFTTSTLGLGGLCIIYFCFLLFAIKDIKLRDINKKHIICLLVIVVLLLCFYAFVPNVQELIKYSFNKVIRIIDDLNNPRMGSTRLRLIGNSYLFNEYSLGNKLFGVGVNQYNLVFQDKIMYAYSNTMVNFLLNSGIVGILTFLLIIAKWFNKTNEKTYVLLFLFVMCADQMIFNWYFFYLIFWIHSNCGDQNKNYLCLDFENILKRGIDK